MSFIDYRTSDQITTMTITREEALNALDTRVLAELAAALERAASDGTRCIILTGAGRAFVAGADVAAMAKMTREEARAFGTSANQVFSSLETTGIPVIAAVNGYALGGGCELALACDIRLASVRAVFAQPEVGLGITPGFGGTQRLPRVVGLGIAKELLYTGRRVDADRALEIGLVNAVHAAEDLLPASNALAAEIVSQAPLAVSATKSAITRGVNPSLAAGLTIETEQFASCFQTDDQREAMAAFTERRPAAPFVGR